MTILLLLALPDLPEEDQLLENARRGNRQAIATIYETYFEPVYTFIRWRVNDAAQAEDLTSEVFIRLIEALNRATAPHHSLRGWLFRVARNVLHDHYQHAGRTTDLDDDLAHHDDAEDRAALALDVERVQQAVRALPPDQQEVLILRFGQLTSVQETAQIMERSVGAVKALQFRAISALRAQIGTLAPVEDAGES